MATFDALIDDLASRFGLGANARAVIREALTMISTSPGGLSGFLDKLKSAGLTSEVASWLGHPDAGPMAAGQVERALGATALSGIAGRFGLAQGVVSTALGYALPKIVGLLTPGGVVPAGAPPEVTSFLSQPATEQVAPRRVDVPPASAQNQSGVARWLWPALAALVVVGLLSYFWSTLHRMPSAPPVAKAPAPTTVAQAPPPPPAPSPAAQPPAPRAGASAGGASPCPCSFSGHAGDRSAGFASAGGANPRAGASGPVACSVNRSTSDGPAGSASAGGVSARPDFAPDGRTDACNPGACGGRNG